jgi:hypothetical protein
VDNDTVTLEDAISFGSGNGETVSTRVMTDRSSQGKLVITSVHNFVWPDELSKTKEGVETEK